MQVYRELPVVTNQFRERPAELAGIVPVDEEWTVARHRDAARGIMDSTEGPVILDAGTGMYLNAIILDLEMAPKVSEEIRSEAESRAVTGGNPRREARRMELDIAGAEERGSIWSGGLKYPTTFLYMRPERQDLDVKIAERSRRIARDGVAEVCEVLDRWRDLGVEPNESVKRSVGFREMASYVRGEETIQWAEDRINVRTRRLARRQMRWFDKLCQSMPEGVDVLVTESPEEEKAISYMRGMIEPWK
jgi:tRNA dimethylallyltransferase